MFLWLHEKRHRAWTRDYELEQEYKNIHFLSQTSSGAFLALRKTLLLPNLRQFRYHHGRR
jgi:hypothetical protein